MKLGAIVSFKRAREIGRGCMELNAGLLDGFRIQRSCGSSPLLVKHVGQGECFEAGDWH